MRQRQLAPAQYQCVDAVVIRACAHIGGLVLPAWPDLTGDSTEHGEQWRRWLVQVWAQDSIAAAIEVASPVLARRAREVCAGGHREVREVRRVVASVVRYVLRMMGRATPFGLFAGVAPAGFGARCAVRWGENHRAVARVDAVWLATVIRRLERCPQLRARLPVVTNNLCFVRSDRLVVPCQQHTTETGRHVPAEVSVRHTRAVEAVLQAARLPVRLGDLAATLAADHPETSDSVIEMVLAELVDQRVLVSSLHPPMTVTDALGHVIEQASAAGADTVPQAAAQVRALRTIHQELSQHNRACSPEAGRGLRGSVSRRMVAISDVVAQPLMVDLRLDCALVLPQAVAREAAAAAAGLARLTRYPLGVPAWQDYHARFLDRYGVGALVPITDLLYSGAGLGFPAGYRDCLQGAPAPQLSARDVRLLTLAQRVAMDGVREVVLDDQMIAELAGHDTSTAHRPPHAELSVQLHAATPDALDQGDFVLVVNGVSRAAGTMAGRFLDLLTPADRARMTDTYATLPTLGTETLSAQVSCSPLYARTENVARTPAVLPRMISLAEHRVPGTGLIPLDDLAVGADAQRLSVVSLSQRRPVEPTMLHAVDFGHRTRPIARFLCEISTAQTAQLPFSWGAASRLPFLPRLRYRRTILSPARWRLAASDLPGPDAPWPQWLASLAHWRHRHRVPDLVYLGRDDRRLRLDLGEPAHLQLLRSEAGRAEHLTVREAPASGAFGWIDGRAHEIVVPLAATSHPVTVSRRQRATTTPPVIGPDHGHLPGDSAWLFVKLYAHPQRHDTILTAHLPSLLAEWDEQTRWWFLPYQDPEYHLRLRIQLPDLDAFGPAARRVGTWATGLRRLGLISTVQWDTYYPETGRFGTGLAMTTAEFVFTADSTTAIAQRAHLSHPDAAHPLALTAASLVDLTMSFHGDSAGGRCWLIDHLPQNPAPAPAREVRKQAIRLADPRDRWAATRALPNGEGLTTAWARRRAALAAYRETITATGDVEPDEVLAALLHLHNVRMAGIAPDTEGTCHHLARAAALSWATQTHPVT